MTTISSISNALSLTQLRNEFSSSRTASQTTTSALPEDSTSGMSNLGSYMKQLKELQESDPEKFKQVMSEISGKLQSAATSATEAGDSAQADMLNDLATKFSDAAETGTMPDLRPPDHGGPQGPPPGPPPDDSSESDSTTDTTSAASSATVAKYQELLSLLSQSTSTDPLSTLSSILGDVLSTDQS
jgi:hypothetical protein